VRSPPPRVIWILMYSQTSARLDSKHPRRGAASLWRGQRPRWMYRFCNNLGAQQRKPSRMFTFFSHKARDWSALTSVLSVATNLYSISNCYPWQMTKKQRLLKQENMMTHPFFSSYTSRLKVIPFDNRQQGPVPPPPTWAIDNVHL